MRWLVVVDLLTLLVALTVSFVRNARAIRRDINRRFDALQDSLEKQANALADELLARGDDVEDDGNGERPSGRR